MNIFIGLKPDKVKHIVCGRSHTIVSTGNLSFVLILTGCWFLLRSFNYKHALNIKTIIKNAKNVKECIDCKKSKQKIYKLK